ncbi:acyl-CoA dehydrogenase [Rhodococcus fascians]|uniref:acyl-CoA dehydrogenase n=1 Tax=Rhodococcoides fascians TaxID=1828 RepID=UPI00195FBD67|nr:acyl-CoA dehydrogenase [Rhodococcus fascians]MBM7244218.1 acyl-CoA dehydrogenase [Rhodococcus fascians]MBY3810426.1 acyl-CoA dehydrogenase [Rhodococcus fascians]MBY3841951.1 acyl-CoA dehydrogenase [Rhodococcus fascians]MBY3844402.1 acyl-CoA dehydrogenase [Rhodococcus fascians]MBY3850348.1 acyl-CoA dehydrogenase [Rhodococcus fascians]
MTDVLSRRDVDFLLYEWLDVESLTSRTRFSEHSKDTFDAVLDLSADIAHKHFAPHNKKSDANEPTMRPDGSVEMIGDIKQALEIYSAAGLLAGPFDERVGGMQLPTTVSRAAMTWFQAANASTASYPFLTAANANLIAAYGTEQQIDDYVRPMIEGRYFGTMCLSEPQAGSSLADITTRAVRQDDGRYRITGTKMWISAGDHDLTENIVHLVLAKVPGGGPGVNGISLFIVPKFLPGPDDGTRNDVTLTGLNHKMGFRGTTNTLLSFGDGTHSPDGAAGAIGFLVGEENRGLSYMFHMMNEARIGVGFVATALGYVGYLKSVDYARTRTQGRRVGAKDPSAQPVALIEHADVRRMLLAQKSYVEGALALGLYCSFLVDEQDSADNEADAVNATLLLDVLTPIAKSWPSQWCVEANNLAIQVHGGYGYTRDYDVEQYYRDNRLNPIHEGTHGIQGLDLLGRKVTMQDGAGLRLLDAKISATVDRAQSAGGDTEGYAADLASAWARLADVTSVLWASGDAAVALANSSIYLEAVGHTVIAWMWLEQLIAADRRTGDFYDGKRQAAHYFFAYELPKVGPQVDLLASLDRTTLDMNPAWF